MKPNKQTKQQAKLRARLIQIIGKKKVCFEDDIKSELIQVYQSMPTDEVDQRIKTILDELMLSGQAKTDSYNQVSLTETGLEEYHRYLALERSKKIQIEKAKSQKREQKRLSILAQDIEPSTIHHDLEEEIRELGTLTGYRTEPKEYHLVSSVIIDVIWCRGQDITHAFEVQNKGDWRHAIGNLDAMKRYFPNCKLYLVVHEECATGCSRRTSPRT